MGQAGKGWQQRRSLARRSMQEPDRRGLGRPLHGFMA
jgi:hypothetical protein